MYTWMPLSSRADLAQLPKHISGEYAPGRMSRKGWRTGCRMETNAAISSRRPSIWRDELPKDPQNRVRGRMANYAERRVTMQSNSSFAAAVYAAARETPI
jgi:hypothetical protein